MFFVQAYDRANLPLCGSDGAAFINLKTIHGVRKRLQGYHWNARAVWLGISQFADSQRYCKHDIKYKLPVPGQLAYAVNCWNSPDCQKEQ